LKLAVHTKKTSNLGKRKKITRMIFFLFLSSITLNSTVHSATPNCSQAILRENVEEIFEICFISGKQSVFESMTSSQLKNNFGSYDNPSREAKLIKAKANLGEPKFQFIWSYVLTYAYLMDFDQSKASRQKFSEIRKEQEMWQQLSAENGFIAAMIAEIDRYLSPYYTSSEEEKVRMLGYANKLALNNIQDADNFIFKIKLKKSSQELKKILDEKVAIYRSLSTEEILDLARFLKTGYYIEERGRMEFPKELIKSEELYHYLINKRNDGESAYLLAKIFEKSDRLKALKFFNLSAKLDYPAGIGWIGDYTSCKGDNKSAIRLLKKAKQLGYLEADDSLGEIEELGITTNCYDGWIE